MHRQYVSMSLHKPRAGRSIPPIACDASPARRRLGPPRLEEARTTGDGTAADAALPSFAAAGRQSAAAERRMGLGRLMGQRRLGCESVKNRWNHESSQTGRFLEV